MHVRSTYADPFLYMYLGYIRTSIPDQEYNIKLGLAIQNVGNELIRAKSLFPDHFVNQHEGYAVILQEVDELWDEIKKNPKAYDIPAQRKEAIQAAAMLIRFIVELTLK